MSDLSEFVKTLTDEELRYIAMHARYAASSAIDIRYSMHLTQDQINEEWPRRVAVSHRWREIADAFHTDPWGPPSVRTK